MKVILSAHCLQREPIGALMETKATPGGNSPTAGELPLIFQYHLRGELFWRSQPELRIPVTALLDTGCDITLVTRAALQRLQQLVRVTTNEFIPAERRIRAGGVMQPVYDLAFLLPATDYAAHSWHGFVCMQHPHLGNKVDMLIGQDLFNQWLLTLDGIHGTLTISVP
jgi:hypothetical protein